MSNPYDYFLKHAYKLEKSKFWAWLLSRKGSPDWERIQQGDWLAHDNLNPDELDAFCLNLRLLIQDQDGFSIRRIRQLSADWPEKYAPLKAGIQVAAEELSEMLDQPSLVSLTRGGSTTNKELFDVVFFGGIAHVNPGKREQFDQITRSGAFSFFAFQAFTGVLFHYRNCVVKVAHQVAKYVTAEAEASGAG